MFSRFADKIFITTISKFFNKKIKIFFSRSIKLKLKTIFFS